jgi:predicted AlkP superfamily pyrophosphatase or phosphodiesterase
MSNEIREDMRKLERLSFLESFISNNDTIEAINEAIDTPPTTTYSSAKEMLDAVLGTEEES